MQRLYPILLLLALSLSGCNPEALRARQWKRYVKELKQAPPVAPDTSTGTYDPTPELEILDQLLRKYPGMQKTRTITKTEIRTVPGKTVYVEVQAKPDTLANRTERDSLLRALSVLAQGERVDSELRAEVARLRASVLRAFNARACLPDTLVRFPAYGLTFEVKRGDNGRYGFRIVQAPQKLTVPTQVTQATNSRVVFLDSKFWQFWQFWLAVAVAARRLIWSGLTRLFRLLVPVFP